LNIDDPRPTLAANGAEDAMRTLVVALMVAAPGVASAADQFDLICSGATEQTQSPAAQPFKDRIRIDLKAGRYCRETCANGGKIAEVTPDLIVFYKSEDSWLNVSRQTGKLQEFIAKPSLGFQWSTNATCTVAPFTGLPSPKF
jgi:hypothetical protein